MIASGLSKNKGNSASSWAWDKAELGNTKWMDIDEYLGFWERKNNIH